MGLRSRLKKIANRFSGEYSEAAPEGEPIPYSREGGGGGGDETPVLKARLKRPREKQDESDSDASN